MSVKFYGDVDRDPVTKQVRSMYPAWYMETRVEELKDEIERTRTDIEMDKVPANGIPEAKAHLAMAEEKLRMIEESRPHLSDGERDRLHKVYKEFAAKIEESLFSYDYMQRGIPTGQDEARRMIGACIKLDSADQAEMAKACNVKIEDKKISRNGATKIFKIVGKLLGKPTNVEVLRKMN